MIGAVLVLGIIVAAVVLVGRRISGKQGPGGPPDIHMVRRFFQYLLLFGLLVVTASGLSGLLGRALEPGALVSGDQSELALSVAFTVVGLPLYAALALWSRRRLAEDPREASSLGWTFYSTVAALTTPQRGHVRPPRRPGLGHPVSRRTAERRWPGSWSGERSGPATGGWGPT